MPFCISIRRMQWNRSMGIAQGLRKRLQTRSPQEYDYRVTQRCKVLTTLRRPTETVSTTSKKKPPIQEPRLPIPPEEDPPGRKKSPVKEPPSDSDHPDKEPPIGDPPVVPLR